MKYLGAAIVGGVAYVTEPNGLLAFGFALGALCVAACEWMIEQQEEE